MWGWYRFFLYEIDFKIYLLAGLTKIFSGISLGMLYYQHYGGGDTLLYFDGANEFKDWPILDFLTHEFSSIDLAKPSRAILFTRIAAMVVYITRADYWMLSAYFSCFSFLGITYLVSKITQIWKPLRWPTIISFFLYPTVVFWSAGLIKESVAFGGMCLLVGAVLSVVYINKKGILAWSFAIFGGALLITLKYYIAALIIPSLVFLFFYKKSSSWVFMPESIIKKIIVIIGVLLLPSLFFLYAISYNFRWDSFFSIVQETHMDILEMSSASNGIVSLELFGGSLDYVFNVFYYVFSGLFRPLVFESWKFPNWASALENSFVLSLVLFSWFRFHKWKHLLSVELVLIVFYVLVASAMLTYAIPNLGAMARFKVYYMPFLMIPLIYTLRKYIIDKRD